MNKIAIISNSAFSVVNFRKKLIEDIIDRGWQVYVLAPDFIDKYRGTLQGIGAVPVDIKMSRTGINPFSDILSLFDLINTLKQISPDITFSYGIKPVIYGLIASKRVGIPNRFAMIAGLGLLYVDGEYASLRRKVLKKLADFMYRFSLKYANKVFFQNFGDIDLFVKKNIVSNDKVTKINGSGVDLDEYELSISENSRITFILISRLIKEKGIYEYVEAAKKIKCKYPTVKFIMLGDRDLNPNSVEKSDLKQWIEEGLIEWPGHVDDVRPWLRKASVFVLPTYYREGIPKSILEAMAMGKPIITTDIPGCREAVKNKENGFLVEPKDVNSLVDAMESYIAEPCKINIMGKKSRKKAEDYFDVSEVNKKIIDVVETHSVL